MEALKIGIDATNIGGGGGITHLKEILTHINKDFHQSFKSIFIFGSKAVLDQIEDFDRLKKTTFPNLNKGLFWRLYFQLFQFDKEVEKNCDVLFTVTGDYVGSFNPVVGMSRNMLLYERDIWKEIKQPKEIIRFWLNFKKQKRCFRNAIGIIFISKYAKEKVSKELNLFDKNTTVINHGVSFRFTNYSKLQLPFSAYSNSKPFKFLYVSTVHVYKHHCNVIEAIANLREKGVPVEIDLVGGIIFEPAGKKLYNALNKYDPNSKFIRFHGHVPYSQIDAFYRNADGILFASTCENMPNILIESMASGTPIACSNKQPMPEFLKENGFYFNSYDVSSIEAAIMKLMQDLELRKHFIKNNLKEIKNYSWFQTSDQTFDFIKSVSRTKSKKDVQK